MKKIFASEFGILPDKNHNYAAHIAEMIEQVGENAEIIFTAGTYLFDFEDTIRRRYAISNTFSVEEQAVSLVLENRNNLVLDFKGSTLLFTGWQMPIAVDGCNGITVKNASIDWKTPTAAEGIVLEADMMKIVLRIDNEKYPHCVRDGVLYFTEEHWGENAYWAAMEYDKDTLRVRKGAADTVLKATFTELNENTVEMSGFFAVPPLKGNYLALRHGKRNHSAVFAQDSQDIRFENFLVHNSCGIAFVCQFCENITMDRVAVVPNEERGRFVTSAHDDAMQFSNCKGDILVSGCRFRSMFDDAVNVHGTSTRIVKMDGSQLVGEFVERCSAGFGRYAKPGDCVSFINRQTLDSYATAVVESFRLLDEFHFEMTFDGVLPEAVCVGDAMENLTNTPAVVIENCIVGSARARGVLVATPGKVVISDNVFDTSGSAILASGDANGWFESGACQDVTIRNNVFTEHCLSSEYQFGEGVISFYPVIPDPQNSSGFHRNIRITSNNFTAGDRRVLYAIGVKGLTFSDNTVVSLDRSGRDTDYTQYVYCSDVQEENNRIVECFPKTTRRDVKIAFLGDSITEGCFELVKREDDTIEIVRDVEFGYPVLLKQLFEMKLPQYQVEIINAGISGNTSGDGLERVEQDVILAKPDLVVVCFGLNDACLRQPEQYAANMDGIFSALRGAGLPVIFMTPNMMNTYVHEKVLPGLIKTAAECCDCQNDGGMDLLIRRGVEMAQKHHIAVCDCYGVWEQMAESGIDTTELLCNYINHPTRQLHRLFADNLFDYVVKFLQE